MMVRIWVVAGAAFREAVRSKVFLNLLLTCVLVLLAGVVMDGIGVGVEGRIYHDVAHAGISIGGSLVALFVGIQLIASDIERKTLHVLLSRPVARHELVLGKYLGLAGVLVLNTGVTLICYALIAAGSSTAAPLTTGILSIALLLLEFLVVGAAALMFSTLSGPTTAAVFAAMLFVVGRLGNQLDLVAGSSKDSLYRSAATVLRVLVPDLTRFDLYAHGALPELSWISGTLLYALLWCTTFLVVAALVFRFRDLK